MSQLRVARHRSHQRPEKGEKETVSTFILQFSFMNCYGKYIIWWKPAMAAWVRTNFAHFKASCLCRGDLYQSQIPNILTFCVKVQKEANQIWNVWPFLSVMIGLLTAMCRSFRMALLLPVPQYAMANVYIPERRRTGSLSVVRLVTSGSASSKCAYIVNAIPTAKPRKIFSCCVSCAYCKRNKKSSLLI